MLETNPALGWRDVQEILVRTARTHRPSDPGWFTNGVGWDFHPDFGAGLVDAAAAVALAASWSPLAHLKAADAGVVDLITIPDGNPTGLTIPLVLTSTQLRAERVTVDVRVLHSRRGQLQLELTSPSGTTSVLKPVMSGDTQADFSPWLFSSVHFWGEAADGVWTPSRKLPEPSCALIFASSGRLPKKMTTNSGWMNNLRPPWSATPPSLESGDRPLIPMAMDGPTWRKLISA
jgi:hypothetical protein